MHELAHLRLEASPLPFEFDEARLSLGDLEWTTGSRLAFRLTTEGAPAPVAPHDALIEVPMSVGATIS
jgi:hypothetical protein